MGGGGGSGGGGGGGGGGCCDGVGCLDASRMNCCSKFVAFHQSRILENWRSSRSCCSFFEKK